MSTLRIALGALWFGLAAMAGIAPADAQNAIQAMAVTSCGTPTTTLTNGKQGPVFQDTTGKLCVNASVSASITGFPTIQTTGTPISVTTGGVTGTLPSGAVVVASNVGATNGAYCKLGASATTSDQLIPPNSWFAFTVGANTQLTCITSTSTTTVNMVGGSGLPTGSGGGGSGGGTSSAFNAAFPANGTAIGLSDGTNLKSLQAAIALGDGVNGNNTAAVATWLWNGATYDRASGTAATGQWIDVQAGSRLYAAATAPLPVKAGTLPSTQTPVSTGTTTPAQSDLNGNIYVNPVSQYPAGAVPITASATGTTGATTATLAASASLKTYICSYSVRANATAVTTVLNTVTGVVTATLSHQMWVPANTAGLGVDEQIFTPCVPSSAINTAVAVVSGAPGTGGVVSVTATGYQAP